MSTSPSSAPTAPETHRIVVLSGPSGSGKTTIVKRLLAESPVPLRMSVSATTRPPRVREVDGQDYYFLQPEEFEARRLAGEFLEYAEVHKSGYWYGTLVSEMSRAQADGKWSLLEVDVQGAMSVMERFRESITIFLMTPDVQEYERRLRSRGTESEAVIQRRLQTAIDELKLAGSYRYRVVNDNLDHAVSEICRVLAAEAKHV